MKYCFENSTVFVKDNGRWDIVKNGNHTIESNELPLPNFEINIEGQKQVYLGNQVQYVGSERNGNELTLRYTYPKHNLEIDVVLTEYNGIFVQQNTVTNKGSAPVLLTRFSSSIIDYVGEKPFYQNEHIRVHICHNKWQCEGQWHSYKPSELGLIPATTHNWERESFRISSMGTWSTSDYYPLVMIEDSENNTVTLTEIEGAHNWFIKVSAQGGYVEPCLRLEASGCDEGNGGWYYNLLPEESYTAERAFVAQLEGGFEEAVATLVAFKRYDSLVNHKNGIPPIVFNDYMDCVWSNQSPSALIPLVETVAKVGCEAFCIDGGWCRNMTEKGKLGDWVENDKVYADAPLSSVVEKIKECGMIPGIWFEWDSCSPYAYGASLDEDALLKRYGAVVNGDRDAAFYNMSNQKVRDFLKSRIKYYYDMGIRYIKNDYNHSMGIGCTNNYDGDSPAEGMIRNSDAFNSFINELYMEFPDLVIENCGSGAMRSDNKTLRNFYLQSTSDQELYKNNPSIVMGTLACIPPEKAGNWAYPYPVMFEEQKTIEFDDAYISARADCKETVFNIVTAMNGMLYLSGRIDKCDKNNLDRVSEGVEFYKNIRGYIAKSRPIYPFGMLKINEKSVASLGLLSDKKLILSVWNLTDKQEIVQIVLDKYLEKDITLSAVYPKDKYEIDVNKTSLSVQLPSDSAVMLVIDK